MAEQLARGIWTAFSTTDRPFQDPNAMSDNLRLMDDHLALYTLQAPVTPDTALPGSPTAGDGQIFTNGSYAVYNDGSWVTYAARSGIRASLANGSKSWVNTGAGWLAEIEPLLGFKSALSLSGYEDLRAYEGEETRVYITGRLVSAAPDGIAGNFVIDENDTTTGDDGGCTIVDANGRRWKRQFSGWVDARWFGAKLDGENDDGGATNAAIAFAWSPAGADSRTVFVPHGRLRHTEPILLLSGVGLVGDGKKHTLFMPEMSDGFALSADITLYRQTFGGFSIDGTNCTGTAKALYIKNGNRSEFNAIAIQNFTNTTVPTATIEGAGYAIYFNAFEWSNNYKHFDIKKIGTEGDFPTQLIFDRCIMEEAQSLDGAAMAITDCSGIKFRDCTVQSNKCLYTLFVGTTTAQVTGDEPEINGGWWEDNGGGQAGSIGVYFHGTASRRLTNPSVKNVKYHQSAANYPTYQIWAEYTDGLTVRDNREGFGAGATFVHDGGGNINYDVDTRYCLSATELLSPIVWAAGEFNGKGGVTVNSSKNCTVTRSAAGSYVVTFDTDAPFANYVVTCNAEDGSASGPMNCSPGIPTDTSSFSLTTTPAGSSTPTDARSISFTVTAFK